MSRTRIIGNLIYHNSFYFFFFVCVCGGSFHFFSSQFILNKTLFEQQRKALKVKNMSGFACLFYHKLLKTFLTHVFVWNHIISFAIVSRWIYLGSERKYSRGVKKCHRSLHIFFRLFCHNFIYFFLTRVCVCVRDFCLSFAYHFIWGARKSIKETKKNGGVLNI